MGEGGGGKNFSAWKFRGGAKFRCKPSAGAHDTSYEQINVVRKFRWAGEF